MMDQRMIGPDVYMLDREERLVVDEIQDEAGEIQCSPHPVQYKVQEN